MNKKTNINLNIIEVSSFVLSLLFMGIYLIPNNVVLVKPLSFILGTIFGFTFISIELFLLLIMNNKYRIIESIYLILTLALGILVNVKVPYAVFLVLLISCIIKGIARIVLEDKVYVGSRYKKYSKIFTTEYTKLIKVFNKKKVLVPVTNKKRVRNKGLQKDLA
jgi:hypothetical protein